MSSGMTTYSHLRSVGANPSDYAIATSRLHYYLHQGLEVRPEVSRWHQRHQNTYGLDPEAWEEFSDPRKLTYGAFIDWQNIKERELTGVLEDLARNMPVAERPAQWLRKLDLLLPPARFLFHGLQMVSSYIGAIAPSGRLTVIAMLQATQEMGRLQRYSHLMRLMQTQHEHFGQKARQVWEDCRAWQPWREYTEKLLVTYDWIEAFVALNLILKPKVDQLLTDHLEMLAQHYMDDKMARFCQAFRADQMWQEQWSGEFVRFLVQSSPEFLGRLDTIRKTWSSLVEFGDSLLRYELKSEELEKI